MIIYVLSGWLFMQLKTMHACMHTTENHACTDKEFQDVVQRDYGVEICNQEKGAGWKGKLDHYFEDYKTLKINLRSHNGSSPLLVLRDCVARIEFFVNEKEEYSLHTGISIQSSVTIYLNEDNCNQNPKPPVLKIRITNILEKKVKVSCFEARKILYDVPKCELKEKQPTATPSKKTSFSVPIITGAAGGGLLLVIALIALGVWLYKKRQRAAEAEEMEMNADINDVYGTYGECGEGDYNIVEDTNPNYETAD